MTHVLIYFKKTNQTFKLTSELKKFHKFPTHKTTIDCILNIVHYHLSLFFSDKIFSDFTRTIC